jgi:phenylacetate-coenzyme A ligase PaaK-like adenylate-forming protein
MNAEVVTDAERYPTLTEEGRKMLHFLREHPHAPIYRNESGNRLTGEDIERVRKFEKEILGSEVGWRPENLPAWLDDFVDRCFAEVPFYRRYGSRPKDLSDIPTISRADLSRDIAQFVPDPIAIERLINFRTSGTTGHTLLLASHPIVAASYLAFHKRALRRFGIDLRFGRGQVGVVLVGYQRKCFTYVSVNPLMNESGLAKINLLPDNWRNPDHRARYLDALAPEVYTGDPISFAELARLPLQTKPRALISTSMTLLPGLRQQLEQRFNCPVLDVYSMNESGPVAVADSSVGGHVLLQHCMYVEITDPQGMPLPTGERGEVTLTGGFNFCLPLLRYRTGDYAALDFNGPEPVLLDLEGRPPVRFRTMIGERINNIEITHLLQSFAIPQYTLHQNRDSHLRLRLARPGQQVDAIRQAMLGLFGAGQRVEIETVESFDGKVVQYTSELEEQP